MIQLKFFLFYSCDVNYKSDIGIRCNYFSYNCVICLIARLFYSFSSLGCLKITRNTFKADTWPKSKLKISWLTSKIWFIDFVNWVIWQFSNLVSATVISPKVLNAYTCSSYSVNFDVSIHPTYWLTCICDNLPLLQWFL